MSKNEFDELLLKKLREADFEYNPASWEKLSALLPPSAPASETSFDELLLKKLQEEELEYKAEHWEQLAAMLPPALTPVANNNNLVPAHNSKRRWALAAGIAAAIILAMGTAVFIKQMNHGPATDETHPSLVQQQPKTKNTLPATLNNNQATPPQPAISVQSVIAPQQQNNTANVAVQQQQQTTNTQNNILQNKIHPLQPVVQQQQGQIAQQETVLPQPITPEHTPVVENPVIATPVKDNRAPEKNYAYNNYDNSAFYEGKGNGSNSNAKTSISLGGGVNYGNLNTGYTAGITVRRKVSGDFFVDGTVAMMYNNNATNIAVNNGPSLAGTASRPAAFNETPLSSPALDPIQKLYYVQFNPSIGYQVEKHVALSIGGDFQKMLNRKEEIVQPESNNARVFPNFDVGLTTKSEFSITPNIQAGLMYREGLNNLIKNDGSKYVNRRYVQVQFKYNIPVN